MLPNLKNSLLITPYYYWDLIVTDRDDNKFVDCAIACQADYIITHDKHFKSLQKITFPKVRFLKMNDLKKLLF
jgi:predicted nucleic acid-binding protein